MSKDHFVPRHYLRQFTINRTEMIMAASASPYKCDKPVGIGGHCCKDNFYEEHAALNKVLGTIENETAPALVRVAGQKYFDDNDLGKLQLLAVILHHRTKKAAEAAKVLPRYLTLKTIQSAIKQGKLPPYPGGEISGEMWDFKGVPGSMIQGTGFCLMEMQTLKCKLLQSPNGAHFVTSDHPVIILNQFCAGADAYRSYAGFSCFGFQLLMPICPNLCIFFYDEQAYRVGSRRSGQLVTVSEQDVEIVNSLQVQSAENWLYFHDIKLEQVVQRLVYRYGNLRVQVQDALKVIPTKEQNKKLLLTRASTVKLPTPWNFCRKRKDTKFKPGDIRNPAWTALGEKFMEDVDKNPSDEDIFNRLQKFREKFIKECV
ncbi:MAG: hypothetical protein JWQ71_2212 [Pedosphaera sp.]|nr:hypothetical protein [Pedosphaera sp.]